MKVFKYLLQIAFLAYLASGFNISLQAQNLDDDAIALSDQ